jgi:hypothetical protein
MRPASASRAFQAAQHASRTSPETVREEALAQIQPDPLDRVQHGGVGRQEQWREVGRDGEILGDLPAGAVHQHDRMSAGADGLAELVEHRLHGGGADRGQDQSDAGVARRTDRTEQIDRLMAQVAHAARAQAGAGQGQGQEDQDDRSGDQRAGAGR